MKLAVIHECKILTFSRHSTHREHAQQMKTVCDLKLAVVLPLEEHAVVPLFSNCMAVQPFASHHLPQPSRSLALALLTRCMLMRATGKLCVPHSQIIVAVHGNTLCAQHRLNLCSVLSRPCAPVGPAEPECWDILGMSPADASSSPLGGGFSPSLPPWSLSLLVHSGFG